MTGPQGPQGFTGAKGDQGIQGPAGPVGAVGPAGPAGAPGMSLRVLDRNGEQLGFPVPWRGNGAVSEMAILMHRDNPDAQFPQGWIMPETSPGTIYYSGSGCIGTALAPAAGQGYGPVLFDNFLYWVPGFQIIYKKTGTVAASASSYRTNGICTNGFVSSRTWSVLEDSGFRLQLENTKPWTLVVE